MRIFSGIKPTGDSTLGNYSGGFRQYVATQELGDATFCIVDLHAITVEYDPADLHARTLDLFAMLIATGLDPERSTVFAQSHVTAHAEASWLLSAVTGYGQLGRMTQFKDKGDAAGVRLVGALQLPGPDGRRHPPLPGRHRPDRRRPAAAPRARPRHRGAVQRRFGEVFTVPDGVYPEVGARIMSLQDPLAKMGKTGSSEQGTVRLLDEPDVVMKKFKTAVTDSGREVRQGRRQAGRSRT